MQAALDRVKRNAQARADFLQRALLKVMELERFAQRPAENSHGAGKLRRAGWQRRRGAGGMADVVVKFDAGLDVDLAAQAVNAAITGQALEPCFELGRI